MKRRTLRILPVAFLTLAVALTACAPALGAHSEPLVAVLNGPTEGKIGGSAEALQTTLQTFGPLRFGFVSSAAMRFAEGHTDLYHDRAVTEGGRIARSYGAAYAVVVGASTLDRQVTLSNDKSARWVTVTLRMQALVVDAATNTVVRQIASQLMEQTRYESTTDPLPDLQLDPTVLGLRDEGIAAIAPTTVLELWHVLGIHAHASPKTLNGSNAG